MCGVHAVSLLLKLAYSQSYEGVQAASGWLLPDEESLRQYALALSHPVSGIPTQVCTLYQHLICIINYG